MPVVGADAGDDGEAGGALVAGMPVPVLRQTLGTMGNNDGEATGYSWLARGRCFKRF